jgi:hypothetical protein
VAAPTVPKTVETSGLELISPTSQQSINRGLEFLSNSQNEDGSLGSGSTYRRHVAVTALAGIAFLSAGSTPNRGKYGAHVEKVVQYLLACTDATGLISAQEHRQLNPMYGHGFATLFLAEVYGMTQRADVREKLKLAVNLIVNTRTRRGVALLPCAAKPTFRSPSARSWPRAAQRRNLVPKSTVELCTKRRSRAANADGGFMYQKLTNQSIGRAPPRGCRPVPRRNLRGERD